MQGYVVDFGFFGAVKMFSPLVCAEYGGDFGAGWGKAAGEAVVLDGETVRGVMVLSFFGNS